MGSVNRVAEAACGEVKSVHRVVTVYYFHDTPGGDRYIAATIWNPDEPAK
jgi:hypothetical protein